LSKGVSAETVRQQTPEPYTCAEYWARSRGHWNGNLPKEQPYSSI